MARHYTANQYEPAYKPKALRNWEVPKFYCDKARPRTGKTKIVGNDNGNLIPGAPRSTCDPWGSYLGTWHLPRRIDRKMCDILNGTVAGKEILAKCKDTVQVDVKDKEPHVILPSAPGKHNIKAKPEEPPCVVIDSPTKVEDPKAQLCPIHDV